MSEADAEHQSFNGDAVSEKNCLGTYLVVQRLGGPESLR